jgi:hypothetical protein
MDDMDKNLNYVGLLSQSCFNKLTDHKPPPMQLTQWGGCVERDRFGSASVGPCLQNHYKLE